LKSFHLRIKRRGVWGEGVMEEADSRPFPFWTQGVWSNETYFTNCCTYSIDTDWFN